MRVARTIIDSAGGVIMQGSPIVLIDGFPVALSGSVVLPHGPSEHSNAIIIGGSPSFVVDGIPVCVESFSRSSCGHPVISSSVVFVI